MRRFWIVALSVACLPVLAIAAEAHAQTAPWAARAEALAHRIQDENLVVNDRVRAFRAREARHLGGQARLQILYDLAAEDYVASNAERAALSIAALHREIAAQRNPRFARMAEVLTAYAPALDGDFLAARRNLDAALRGETDPYVIAAGERFRAYCLTDLGLVGNALEAARSGLQRLPETADAATLRSGLHDAISYTSMRIGDVESGFDHLARSVEFDVEAGKPVDGLTVTFNVASMLADSQLIDDALEIAEMNREMAMRSATPEERFFAELLCARVNFEARDYATVVRCGNMGRAIAGAPPEYLTRLLVLRAHALARRGNDRTARQALVELRAIAAERGDPVLSDEIDAIEPEVLFAQGRSRDAYIAMRDYHEIAERDVLRRFNSGVKELRATMEDEIARAEERARQERESARMRGETIQVMKLAMILAGLALGCAVVIAVLIYRSRRAMRKAEENAHTLARQDALTGLGNRRALHEEFEARTGRPDAQFALLLIDLDRFKPINDAHGHAVGDQSLKIATQRLLDAAGEEQAVFRLGGDEFAVLTGPDRDATKIAEISSQILSALIEPFQVGGSNLQVGASIGVAMYPKDADNMQQLLQFADAAMYHAKERRGEVRFFNAAMDEVIRTRAELEMELRAAVSFGAIVPYFQPIMCLKTRTLVGHEMLARWPHKTRGFVPPDTFIPIAEQAGLIDTLFWQLLDAACAAHLRAGAQTQLSVNIAAPQIGDQWFAQKLIQALAKAGFPPSRIEIEVTESDLIVDCERARSLLLSLRNQGVKIALDDFGTGYSSLLMLRDLPIDKLKIDRSFVSGLGTEGTADVKIVEAIISMAAALDLTITAEGIESEAAAQLLGDLRCDYGQGFLFGAAQPGFELPGDIATGTGAEEENGTLTRRAR